MKYTKPTLFAVFVLASCGAPATPAPTQTPAPEQTMVDLTPSVLVTPDPAMGNISGNISWKDPNTSPNVPIAMVNLEINGHSDGNPRYTATTDLNGNYTFVNIEPVNYGFGVYFSLSIGERLCDNPEFLFDTDLDWLHYATALKGDLWFDIIFSNKDVMVNAGETFTLDFELKCP